MNTKIERILVAIITRHLVIGLDQENCIGACNQFPNCAYQCIHKGYPSGDCTTKGHDPPCACCCNPK
ncbi:hypothetical protein DCAR_0832985 [Daucus carota subsp. sativus]|uniref:Knottin scorpion toxin-like domain-containing protein n=1 Tax=Daucus carota subsp. sativus TaxID=79200 RepID=A0AAF1BBL7_DAUCS|nr:hypothetical protein DCAR_0832985 [Daucus carota subsp. sativus]